MLLTKLRDPSSAVAARVLTALGELATVAGEDISKYLEQLLPMIIEALQVRGATVQHLRACEWTRHRLRNPRAPNTGTAYGPTAPQDQSSISKREAALVTLGKLVLSTGSVIDPYLKYPSLLGILINFLKTEQQPSLRRETMKVLGILGALDPYKHTVRTRPGRGRPDSAHALLWRCQRIRAPQPELKPRILRDAHALGDGARRRIRRP